VALLGSGRSDRRTQVRVALACFFASWIEAPAVHAEGALGPAAAESSGEYRLKAAYLFNFAKFVTWPAAALPEGAPLTICMLADDPTAPTIREVLGDKTLGPRRVLVRVLADLQGGESCQMFFLSDSDGARAAKLLRSLGPASVLTVGETSDFIEHGGVIRFRIEANKVRFDINPDAAVRARLEISSQLLSLATIVRDRNGGGK
jgi:hypothetical protein